MASNPTFATPGGLNPVEHILRIAEGVIPTEGDCLAAGAILHANIKTRTSSGRDSDGNEFAPYSKGYAKFKNSHGVSPVVNLFGVKNHPHMMNGILILSGGSSAQSENAADVAANPFSNLSHGNEIRLEIYGEQSIRAKVHNEGGTLRTRYGTGKTKKPKGSASFGMPERHFFDANRADIDQMGYAIRERIQSRIRAAK
jgi:hypothetical protein